MNAAHELGQPGGADVCETPAAAHDDRRDAPADGMTGGTSGPAVSLAKTSKTTHVSEVGRPPGGSVPPGPFPKVFPRLHREPHVAAAAAGATFAARSRTRRRRGPSPRTRPR